MGSGWRAPLLGHAAGAGRRPSPSCCGRWGSRAWAARRRPSRCARAPRAIRCSCSRRSRPPGPAERALALPRAGAGGDRWPVAASVRLISSGWRGSTRRPCADALRDGGRQDLNSMVASVLGQPDRSLPTRGASSRLHSRCCRDGGFAPTSSPKPRWPQCHQAVARPLHASGGSSKATARRRAIARLAGAGETLPAAPQLMPQRTARGLWQHEAAGHRYCRRPATSCRPPDTPPQTASTPARAAEAMSEYRIDEQVEHWAASGRAGRGDASAPRRLHVQRCWWRNAAAPRRSRW